VLAREHAHVMRVLGVEANAVSYCVQRNGQAIRVDVGMGDTCGDQAARRS
jgi:hypothetical protein